MLLKKDFVGGLRATLIQDQGQTRNLESKIYLPGFHRFKFEFHSFFAETFSTVSTPSRHKSARNPAVQSVRSAGFYHVYRTVPVPAQVEEWEANSPSNLAERDLWNIRPAMLASLQLLMTTRPIPL